MALFDFLKKGKDTTTSANAGVTTGRTASAFKGDLAMIQEVKKDATFLTETVHNVNSASSDNKDSEDSVIFMTFSNYTKAVWYCPECGTANDGTYDGCVVCGLKR